MARQSRRDDVIEVRHVAVRDWANQAEVYASDEA